MYSSSSNSYSGGGGGGSSSWNDRYADSSSRRDYGSSSSYSGGGGGYSSSRGGGGYSSGGYGGGGSRGGYGGGGAGGGYGNGGSGDLGANLDSNIQWDISKLPVFEKNFYYEHPDVAKRSPQEYEEWKRKHDINVNGKGVPKCVYTFEEASFPGELFVLTFRAVRCVG